MSSSKHGDQENVPRSRIEVSDIANSAAFMNALVAFLNEAYICMQEVRHRAGVSPGCGTSVTMNDEEKEDKLNIILTSMTEKCQKEVPQRPTQYNEPYGFPPQEDECNCPTDLPMSSASRYSRGRRADTPRLGASSYRSRVATPDPFYMPASHSSMSPPSDYTQIGQTYSMMSRSRTAPRASSRSASPLPPMSASSAYGAGGCATDCGQLGGGKQYRR